MFFSSKADTQSLISCIQNNQELYARIQRLSIKKYTFVDVVSIIEEYYDLSEINLNKVNQKDVMKYVMDVMHTQGFWKIVGNIVTWGLFIIIAYWAFHRVLTVDVFNPVQNYLDSQHGAIRGIFSISTVNRLAITIVGCIGLAVFAHGAIFILQFIGKVTGISKFFQG